MKLLDRLARVNRLFLLSVAFPTLVAVICFGLIASDIYISESRFMVRTLLGLATLEQVNLVLAFPALLADHVQVRLRRSAVPLDEFAPCAPQRVALARLDGAQNDRIFSAAGSDPVAVSGRTAGATGATVIGGKGGQTSCARCITSASVSRELTTVPQLSVGMSRMRQVWIARCPRRKTPNASSGSRENGWHAANFSKNRATIRREIFTGSRCAADRLAG